MSLLNKMRAKRSNLEKEMLLFPMRLPRFARNDNEEMNNLFNNFFIGKE